MTITKFGRFLFAASLGALGLQHLIVDHISVAKPGPESSMGLIMLFAGFVYKFLLITLSMAVMLNFKCRTSTISLAALLFTWTLLRHFPFFIANLTSPDELNTLCTGLALTGGACIIANSYSNPAFKGTGLPNLFNQFTSLGKFFYGMPMLVFGAQHILYVEFIASFIPTWIPGSYFWTYATGIAFILAGISIMGGWKVQWSSLWLAMLMAIWAVAVHLPRIIMHPNAAYEWTHLFQVLGLGASAFVLYATASVKSQMHIQHASLRSLGSKGLIPRHTKQRYQKKSQVKDRY